MKEGRNEQNVLKRYFEKKISLKINVPECNCECLNWMVNFEPI